MLWESLSGAAATALLESNEKGDKAFQHLDWR